MSRCQHGQFITQFCVSESCTWREVGGCPNCMKKYHQHAHSSDILRIQKLQQYIRLLSVSSEVKPKSKVLQEAVYNYFIIVKNQINTSLDTISRNIGYRLIYPYMVSEGQFGLVKKVKNKQYKKISKKELNNFCDFISTQNKQIIQFNETKLYKEQVNELTKFLAKMNQIFINYTKVVEKFDNSFNVQRSFYNKITEICNSIQPLKPTKIQEKHRDNGGLNNQQKQVENRKQLYHLANPITNVNVAPTKNDKKPGRDRKVSLDYGVGVGVDSNKFRSVSVNQSFDQNQKQIVEKKKRLFDMLNNPQGSRQLQRSTELNSNIQITKLAKNQNQQKLGQNKRHEIQNKSSENKSKKQKQGQLTNATQRNQKKTQIKPETKQLQEEQIKTPIQFLYFQEQQKQAINKQNKQQRERFPLFQQLLSQGINLPQIIIAHTKLPRQASKQKLYEDTRDVKERKIMIPVKKFQQDQENYSPILKQKRQNRQQVKKNVQEANMVEVNLFNKTERDPIKQQVSQNQSNDQSQKTTDRDRDGQTPKKSKEDEKLMLKDKQADSLALLIQSLPLQAEKAIPLLQASIKFAHNNLSAAQYLSYLYLQISKPKNCLQLCNKMLQQLQESPQANDLSIHIINNKAVALNMLGRYSQSITILQKCLTNTKRDVYYKNLGDAYFSISIYEKAILNYQNAIKLNNKMDEAYYNLAVCFYMQDHFNQAKLNVEKAILMNPKNQEYLRLNRQIMIKLQMQV